MPVAARPAATVILLRNKERQIEVLLLRRNPVLAFAGDCWVFPGGQLEPCEIEAAGDNPDAAFRNAATRECFEESGIVVEARQLVPVSHWITPAIQAKRFATQFYISLVPGSPQVTIDQAEIIEYKWLNATAAITAHRLGQLQIMPPTLVTLSELSNFKSHHQAVEYYRNRNSSHYYPRVKFHSKTRASFLFAGDSGYADTNPELCEQLNRCEMKNGIFEYKYNLDSA